MTKARCFNFYFDWNFHWSLTRPIQTLISKPKSFNPCQVSFVFVRMVCSIKNLKGLENLASLLMLMTTKSDSKIFYHERKIRGLLGFLKAA